MNLSIQLTNKAKVERNRVISYFKTNLNVNKNLTTCCQSTCIEYDKGKTMTFLKCSKCNRDVTIERIVVDNELN